MAYEVINIHKHVLHYFFICKNKNSIQVINEDILKNPFSMKITNCDLMNNRCEMVLESLNKKLLENLKNLKGNAI